MKKKFLAMYALAGVLVASPVFTSCVDNEESPSVENIRNAKAEQLKALAALQTAQAEAAKVTANAEAAYKAAQAAYQEALAEAEKAEAAYQAEMLKQAQEKFVVELERIKAQAEQQISYAKLEAMKNMAAIEDFENEELKDLYVELQGAIAKLNNLNEQKLNTTNWYNQAKAGLVNTEAQKDYQVKRYDKLIAQEEFKIATYEKYEGADIEKLKNDRTIAEKEARKLQEAAIPYQEARNEAWDKFYEANDAWYESDPRGTFAYYNGNPSELAILDIINEVESTWYYAGNEVFFDRMVNDQEDKLLAEGYSIPYYTINTDQITLVKAQLELDIDRDKDNIGTPAVAATETTAAVEATGMYRDIEIWKKDIETYKGYIEDEEEALAENPNETWRENNIASYKQMIVDRENNIAQRENDIEDAKFGMKKYEDMLALAKKLEAAFAADSEEMVAYEAAIAAQKALADAAVAAKEAAEKADEELEKAEDATQAKWDEYYVLDNKINNSADVEQIIANCQRNINNYKSLKQSWLNDVANGETNIAVYEAELETIEAQIKAQEEIIANLQAEIDALTATEEA